MINPKPFPTRATLIRAAFVAACCALGLAVVQTTTLNAADAAATPPASADKGPKLPLTFTFEKVQGGENGPFVLKLKNTSTSSLKVNTKVLLAVVFHAADKARKLPEQTIEAGKTWSVPDLAAADKVIITAAGFAPLEIVVP